MTIKTQTTSTSVREKLAQAPRVPSIGDRWLDSRGEAVTITGLSFNRVTFLRDGYEHPCIYPDGRFTREFKPATLTAH